MDSKLATRVAVGLVILAATLLNAGSASAQTGVYLYIPNNLGNSITVNSVDAGGALTPVTTITAGIVRPYAAAVSPDQRWVYVTMNTTAEMVVIDASTNTVVSTVTTGTNPSGVAVSPDGTKVWVCNLLSDSLSTFSVNTVTGALTATGDIAMAAGTRPHWLAFLPSGAAAYVANVSTAAAGSVGVVNVASQTILTTINTGGQIRGIAVNPSGTRAFATDPTISNVRVIDTATNTQIGTLTANVSVPDGITVSRDGQWLYVANQATNTIAGFDVATLAPRPPVATGSGPAGLVITPDTLSLGPVLYGTNTNSANVSGFAIAAGTGALTPVVGSPFAVGSSPRYLGVCRTETGTFATGATFDVTVASAPCIGANSLIAGGTLTSTGLPSIAVPLTLGTGGLIAFPAAGSFLTLSGVLSGTGGITKGGPGRVELTGANTYSSATTVNSGDFILTGSTSVASAITVASGGNLLGAGVAAGPVTIQGGGGLRPGRGGPGIIGTGNLALNAGSFLELELNGVTAGTGYDRVNVTGTVTLGGTLTGSVGFVPTPGQVFLIVNNDGADPIGGTFAGQPEGSTVLISGTPFRVSYVGGDGNDVALTAVALPAISTSASPGVIFGGSVSDTATISAGAAPTGSITFRLYGPNDATCAGVPVFIDTKPVAGNGSYVSATFSPTAIGVYRWTASYSGDANNGAVAGLCNDANESVTIAVAPQTLTFAAQSPASRTFAAGGMFAISPVASSAAPNSGNAIVYSSLTAGVCTVAGTTVTMVAAGTCTIAANQAGNTNFTLAVQATQNVAIGVAAQVLTFPAPSPASRTFTAGATFAISPVATSAAPNSGSAIVYSSLTAGVCTVAGTTVTMVAAGTCTIAANQAGDVNYAAATQATQNVAIGVASQTLTFPAQSPASRPFAPGATFAISPVATSAAPNSGSAIVYSSLTTGVCTVAGTTVTMVAVGTCTIAANQAGDANYAAASQVTQGVSITAAAVTSYTGPSATGTGSITASFTGGGAGCTFATSQFIPVTGHASSPPANVTPPAAFPHGLFDFTLTGCTPGSAVTMTVTYPAPLVPTPLYWKYGPTPTDTAPHWYVLPATIAGSTATFTITDGQVGDDDLAPNGTIVDQGGPGVPIVSGAVQTPTLSEWAMLLLAFLMLATGLRRRLGAARAGLDAGRGE